MTRAAEGAYTVNISRFGVCLIHNHWVTIVVMEWQSNTRRDCEKMRSQHEHQLQKNEFADK